MNRPNLHDNVIFAKYDLLNTRGKHGSVFPAGPAVFITYLRLTVAHKNAFHLALLLAKKSVVGFHQRGVFAFGPEFDVPPNVSSARGTLLPLQ